MSEEKTINLNSGSKSVIKMGLVLRALIVLFCAACPIAFGIDVMDESLTVALICFAIGAVLLYVLVKILNGAFYKESLLLTKEDITVIHKNLSGEKTWVFDLDEITYFGFSEQKYTKHQMDNPVVDFTGLGTAEKELQYIIDEGNIKIEAGPRNIKFGKNMPSWDVEEIIDEVELFTGRSFRTKKVFRNKVEEEDEV